MDVMIQAFIGSHTIGRTTAQNCRERICYIMDILPVQAVIIGWHSDVALYEVILDEAHRRGKSVFLWLPIFSDMPEFLGIERAINLHGKAHKEAAHGYEDFSFLCPSSTHNIDTVKRIYLERFSNLRFDGIFLDKIRYSSFGNGFSAAIGCFCDTCMARYIQCGVDIVAVVKQLQKDASGLAPYKLDKFSYVFEDALLDTFYRVRAGIVTDAVYGLIEWFQSRGLKVGLDVFSPPFAYYVGQDIMSLSEKADFIKPMIYRVTDAPAGMPYENRSMYDELQRRGCNTHKILEHLWDCNDICGEDSLLTQLERLAEVRCPMYIGVEVNYIPEICRADRMYVLNTIGMIKQQKNLGCVLSWDVLSDTKDHLEALAAVI